MRSPYPKPNIGNTAGHRCLHHLAKVVVEIFWFGDDIDGAHERRRDSAKLFNFPVGTDAAAVALEDTLALRQGIVEYLRFLALLAAVCEEDRMSFFGHHRREQTTGRHQPRAERCCAVGLKPLDGLLCIDSLLRVHANEFGLERVDHLRLAATRNYCKEHAVVDLVDGRHACPPSGGDFGGR